jgi:hypothetical protein
MFGINRARRRTHSLVPIVGLLTALVGLGACGESNNNLVGPTVVGAVATFRDSTFNFGALSTFSMPDTVVQFTPATGTPIAVSRQWDAAILTRVAAGFESRGYTRVTASSTVTPDFVVLVGATATTNYNAFVSYPWFSSWGFYSGWAWYAPGFDASWGIVYPWYGVVGVTSYDRGTVVVTAIPTRSVAPASKTITAVWAGVATALVNGTVTVDHVNAAIDQMFTLSPYFTRL